MLVVWPMVGLAYLDRWPQSVLTATERPTQALNAQGLIVGTSANTLRAILSTYCNEKGLGFLHTSCPAAADGRLARPSIV